MEEEAAAMAAASIPDDVLLEILVRVKEAADIFRCAMACKRWRRLVIEPSFLRRRWPEDAPAVFVGLFIRECRRPEGAPSWEHCFFPAPRSPLGTTSRRPLSSFMTTARDGLFDRAVPLVARHGLVLVRLITYDTLGNMEHTILQLAVCNLLVGTWDMLPTIYFGQFAYFGYAILTGADCRSKDEPSPPVLPDNSCLFKVVIIGSAHDDLYYSLCVFSSDKASWSVYTNCFDSGAQSHQVARFSDAIVCGGMVHWVFHYYGEQHCDVINLNARTGHISLTKLPFKEYYQFLSHPCLTLSANGALSLLWLQSSGSGLVIWKQQEKQHNTDVTSEWLCTRMIELKQPEKETQLCALREKCGTLLISDNNMHVYTANLETRTMEEVVDWHQGPFVPSNAMPLEIDWPTIFISLLTR
ncbi:hypothetical protein VPH35_048284 [Triticum aestivum]